MKVGFAFLIFISYIAFVISHSGVSSVRKPIHYTAEAVKTICKSKQPDFPLRCQLPTEDLALPGKTYLAKSPEPLQLQPVVLFPGLGGSGLQAKLHKSSSPSWYCYNNWNSWFRIWLAFDELFVQDCWADNMKLVYHPGSRQYNNTEGVSIEPIDYGGIGGIDYISRLEGFPLPFTSVYSTMVRSLIEVGYKPGVNLRGSPFDFRLPVDCTMNGMHDSIQQLIEDTYQKNNKQKVNIVTHSMGGPLFVSFLNTMSEKWRETYIANFIPIAGPWAGAPKALRSLISGDTFGLEVLGIPLVDKMTFRSMSRTYGGVVSLIPDSNFWGDQVFVVTPQKNYTSQNFFELFVDIGAPITAEIYTEVRHVFANMKAPNVQTYCLYGDERPTEFWYVYKSFDEDPVYTEYTKNGDGTVPNKSLEKCQIWQNEQKENVTIHHFDESDHTSILEDQKLIHFILDILTGKEPNKDHS